jgi:hypothetical protein
MSRYIYQPRTERNDMTKAVVDALIANPGRKFWPSELAALTHKPQEKLASLLSGYCLLKTKDPQRDTHGLRRDQLSNPAHPRERYRYWIPPVDGSAPASAPAAPEKKELSPLAKKITKHFQRHHKSARPSVIAAAIKEDQKAVAQELERMHRARAALRCTLLNRHGVDRHEYRLIGAHSPMTGAL